MFDAHVTQKEENSLLPLLRLHFDHRRRNVDFEHHFESCKGTEIDEVGISKESNHLSLVHR